MSVQRSLVFVIDALKVVQTEKAESVELLTDYCVANGMKKEIVDQLVASEQPIDLGRVNRAIEAPAIVKEAAEGAVGNLPPDTPLPDNTLPAEEGARRSPEDRRPGDPKPGQLPADDDDEDEANPDGDPVDDPTWHELQQKGSELGVYRAGMSRKKLEKAIERAEAKAERDK